MIYENHANGNPPLNYFHSNIVVIDSLRMEKPSSNKDTAVFETTF